MELMQAFPVAIIDEDYEGKNAAGRGMQQLAAAIEKEGLRVVAGVSYEDARRLVNVFNNESCWLISVDGTEAKPSQWQVLEEVLAAKRSRNDRLPIFLFGDERTAELVPASVLKHANAFMRLFEDSPEFIARAIARAAQLYLERLPPPMFKSLREYPLHASYSGIPPATAAEPPSGRARSGISSIISSVRTRCGPTSPSRSARSDPCWIIPVRLPPASGMRRGSSAPTKPCSWSAAPRPPTRSSGMAPSRAATSCCA